MTRSIFTTRLRATSVFFLAGSALTSCTTPNAEKPAAATALAVPASQSSVLSNYEKGLAFLHNAKDRFDYPKAVEFLEKAVAEDGNNAHARFSLIHAYVKRSQYEKAEAQLNLIQTQRAELSTQDGLWLNALEARVKDNIEGELSAWAMLIKAYPADRWALYEASGALMSQERYAEATEIAERALELENDPQKWSASWIYYILSKSLFRSGDYAAAIEAAAPAETTPVIWRAVFFRKALAQFKAGESGNADKLVEEYKNLSAKEGRNNSFVISINSGMFYYEIGAYKKAVEQLKATRAAHGESHFLSANLGYNLIFADQVKEAVLLLSEDIKKFPKKPNVMAAYGWALYNNGQFEAAREALRKAKAMATRRSFRIEKDLETIEAAINNSETDPKAYVPWLG